MEDKYVWMTKFELLYLIFVHDLFFGCLKMTNTNSIDSSCFSQGSSIMFDGVFWICSWAWYIFSSPSWWMHFKFIKVTHWIYTYVAIISEVKSDIWTIMASWLLNFFLLRLLNVFLHFTCMCHLHAGLIEVDGYSFWAASDLAKSDAWISFVHDNKVFQSRNHIAWLQLFTLQDLATLLSSSEMMPYLLIGL